MSDPTISVIIPAYNVEQYVAETIESLKAQTFEDYEAIIVNDGSSDHTENAIKPFLDDPRLHYIYQQNAGAAEARNTALKVAKGKWIALLDADDIWLPTKLEEQIALTQSDPLANIVYSNVIIFYMDGRQIEAFIESDLPDGDITAALYARNCVWASSAFVRSEDLRKIGGFTNQKLVEDYDTWLKLAHHGIRAKKCIGPTVKYRVRPGSQVSASIPNLQILIETLKRALDREDRGHYRRILRSHIGRIQGELAYMLAAEESRLENKSIKRHLWKAWQHQPKKLKWLILASICSMGIGQQVVARRLRKNIDAWDKERR
jgi:glycosyltransferase involved in cell wall biosynthesis